MTVMADAVDLHPCMCGAPAELKSWAAGKYYVCCIAKDCDVETGTYKTKEAAATAWRSRIQKAALECLPRPSVLH